MTRILYQLVRALKYPLNNAIMRWLFLKKIFGFPVSSFLAKDYVKFLNSRPKINIAFPSGTTKNGVSLILLRFEQSTKQVWAHILKLFNIFNMYSVVLGARDSKDEYCAFLDIKKVQ